MRPLLPGLIACALAAGAAVAGEKEDSMRFVSEASALANKDKAAALAEISNPKGRFVAGEVYVFAFDLTGTVVAHPVNSKLIGKNTYEVPDVNGKLWRKEVIDTVKAKGEASVEYKYKNPVNAKLEDKITYCKKASDLAICAGYYK